MIHEVMPGAEPSFHAGTAAGVLLLHDLAGTPDTFRGLAEALCEADFTVDIPLLPGHGTAVDDLMDTTWDDWASAAQLALDEIVSRCGPVVVGGIAMGATLACWVAAQRPEVAGVVAINPRAQPVPQEAFAMLSAMQADGCVTVAPLGQDVSDHTARVLAYDTVPISTLLSMFEALNIMADHWDELDSPILVATSSRDHRVLPVNGDWLAQRVSGPVERLTLEHSFHLATVDVDHDQLERAVVDFTHRRTAAMASGSPGE